MSIHWYTNQSDSLKATVNSLDGLLNIWAKSWTNSSMPELSPDQQVEIYGLLETAQCILDSLWSLLPNDPEDIYVAR